MPGQPTALSSPSAASQPGLFLESPRKSRGMPFLFPTNRHMFETYETKKAPTGWWRLRNFLCR